MIRVVALVIAVVITAGGCTQPASSAAPAISPAPAPTTNADPTPAALQPSPVEPGYGTPSPGT